MEIRNLSKSQVEIKISVSAAELEKFLNITTEEFSKDLKIDGFRPGKAPRGIVEQRVGSEKILAHATEKAVKKSYVDAITKNSIEAVGEPEITITKIAPGNDLEYKAIVSIIPKIDLGNYRSRVKTLKKTEPEEIKPADIQKELDYLRKSRAKLVTVSRGAKKGDRVEIDFQIMIAGKEIEGGASKKHPLTIGENYFIPGFEDNLIGMKENEERKFKLEFPKDYHKKDLSEKPAAFKVKMNIVQEVELPEVNNAFARDLGKFENLENLRNSISEGLTAEQQKKSEEKWQQEMIEKIISGIEFEIPSSLIENELEKMMAEFEQNIAGMGMKLDDYLTNIKKSKEEIRENWHENAKKRIKSSLALREIAKLENINPEPNEIEEEMNRVLAHFRSHGDMEKNIDMEKLYDYAKAILTNDKVFQFLGNLRK